METQRPRLRAAKGWRRPERLSWARLAALAGLQTAVGATSEGMALNLRESGETKKRMNKIKSTMKDDVASPRRAGSVPSALIGS